MPRVQVYSCLLSEHRSLLARAVAVLAADESARAARFKDPIARDEYVLSRVLLRRILAGHLQRPAERIVFAGNAYGKPHLVQEGRPGPEFNLSHSGGRLLVAICEAAPVGIDVERIHPDLDPIPLARTGLPEEDCKELLATAAETRPARFCQLWTRWEAYLKALGHGFGGVPVAPARTVRGQDICVRTATDPARCALIRDLPERGEFRAAVAVLAANPDPEPITLEWPTLPAAATPGSD